VLRDLEIRTDGSPAALAGTVRRTLQEEAPGLPVVRIQSLADRVDDNLSNDRMIAALTSAFGGLALLLACLGLYGTVSYGISRRVSELGLRMALGADRSMVLWMVMREALLLVGAGAAIGVPLAFVAGRSVRSLLYTIVPADPVSYAAGSVLLLVVAALAAYVPAYRASRIEPMIALGRN
jgi:ABC-type antimicrobial peptide transport system permease subunit